MRMKIIKAITFAASYLISLVVFAITTNQVNADLTATMEEATLPIISFYYEDTQIEQLHAYVSEMDVSSMRDSILPVDDSRMVELKISTYGYEVDSVTYQIRSTDGSRLIADGEISEFETDGQTVSVDFQVQNLLTEDEEYALVIRLHTQEQTLCYYCRIMYCGDSDMQEYLDFVNEFHEYTFREDADEFIPTYMEEMTGNTSTLQYVDLNCTLNQITWGSFTGEVLGEPVISIKEILDTYTVITMEYVMTSVNEDGETEYYNIEEYYRLRNTSDRMYVLNFERTMNQIFRGENNFVSDSSSLLLGIRDSDVHYMTSESGDKIAFVQEGELWCYDSEADSIVQVFSFRSTEGIDARENWDEHEIKIVRIDEAGSLDFIVYGYMNRGSHEGEVGIAVYHYDAVVHTVEEEAFLPSDRSYELVKAEMGQLMYESDSGVIYLMMEGNVYGINLSTLEMDIVISGLEEGSYAISRQNRYLAWVEEEDPYTAEVIYVMDFSTGQTQQITAEAGMYILPLAFFGEDLIYGAAESARVAINNAGNLDFPMSCLRIVDLETGDILKEYSKEYVYVAGITVESTYIIVDLIQEDNGTYVSAGEDTIMDREADTDEALTIDSISAEDKLLQVVLETSVTLSSGKITMLVPKTVILEEDRTLSIETENTDTRYYVYVKGEVLMATDHISDAITKANDNAGVVVDRDQQYLWMRARSTSREAISVSVGVSDTDADSIAQCISAVLYANGISINVSQLMENGSTPKEILENALEDYRVLDLTGCPIEGLLFYISNGNPVFAMTDADEAVLIVGYTSETVTVYDPTLDGTKTYSYSDAESLFSAAGNIFFGYY